jgi:hypothetical protein
VRRALPAEAARPFSIGERRSASNLFHLIYKDVSIRCCSPSHCATKKFTWPISS